MPGGQSGDALDWLATAVERGSLELMYIRFRPEVDSLRNDPGFIELIRQQGLPGE